MIHIISALFKPNRFLFLLVSFTIILSGASFAQTIKDDTVIVSINGTDITAAHIVVLVDRLPAEYQNIDDKTLFDGIMEQLIAQTLLGQASGYSKKKFALISENENRALLAGLEIGMLIKDATTDVAIQAAYNAQYKGQPMGTEFRASHILVKTQKQAENLLAEIQSGHDFAAMAQEKSIGPSGNDGGDLGWFVAEDMVAEFSTAVQALEIGALSQPIETQFGWHIILLNETRDKSAPSLADVRQNIIDQLSQAAIQSHVVALEQNADIINKNADINPAFIRDLSLLE